MAEGSDWEYPSGSDVITICGEGDDRELLPPPGPALGASYTRGAGRQIDPVRVAIWTLTGLLALCVSAVALAGWSKGATHTQSNASGGSYPLNVVFGDPGNGGSSVCTDETLDTQSGSWSCTTWATNSAGLPTASAVPTSGTCSERRVDQSAGRWVCVRS